MVHHSGLFTRSLAACAAVLLCGTASQAAQVTYTATVNNWFAPGNPYGNTYFGSTIDDDQVFVYIKTGGGTLSYFNAVSGITTAVTDGNVYNLQANLGGSNSGTFTMVGNNSARFVFGFGGKTAGTVTQPSNFVNGSDPTTPYYAGALGLFEWTNSAVGYENMDMSYEYNSGFPMSYVVVDGTAGARTRSSGIKAGSAAGIVDSLKTNFATLNSAFAIKDSGTNVTGAPAVPYPTAPPPYNSLSQAANGPYFSNNQSAVTWGSNNVTGLAPGDVWKADTNRLGTPASGTSAAVPANAHNIYTMGNSFTGYLSYLATHNSGTYSIDYTGDNGYAATLAVTDTGTAGYQLSVTNIRQGVTFNPDGSYVAGSGSAVGSFSFFAQNAVIPPGNAISGTTNDVYVGQWNDHLIQSGAPVTVDPSAVNLTTTDSTGIIASICGSISASMQYGFLGSPAYVSSLSGPAGIQGTNWWFDGAGGAFDKATVNSNLFANLWTTGVTGSSAYWDEYLRTMLQATGTLGPNDFAPYFYAYADRIAFMSPDLPTVGNAAITFNLGSVVAVPEPSVVALLSFAGATLGGLGWRRRRRGRRAV